MKLIGLLGGMSWDTTATYYRMMNEYAQRARGGRHSARILMHSIDFRDVDEHRREGNWDEIGRVLGEAARSLKAGGADFIVLATNGMHRLADRISQDSELDLLHIADPVGFELRKNGHRKVALLGTCFTMESDFYDQRLGAQYGLSVIKPNQPERAEVHRIIYEELGRGVIRTESRQYLGALIGKLHERGADAVILGCSAISKIIPTDCDLIPAYDTTRLHACAAIKRALDGAPA